MADRHSPDERNAVLDTLLTASQGHPGLVAAVLVGSGAHGFTDEYSDIDMVVVADDAADVDTVSDGWKQRLLQQLPVMASSSVVRAPRVTLHNLYLSTYLEVNTSVLPLHLLQATKPNYRVLWDTTGTVEATLDSTWAHRRFSQILPAYLEQRNASVWHYINHADIALRRNRPWQALWDIEELRSQIIHIRAHRMGLDPNRNRDTDALDAEFKGRIAELLVGSLDPGELRRTLVRTTALYFAESRNACADIGVHYDLEHLEERMRTLVGTG